MSQGTWCGFFRRPPSNLRLQGRRQTAGTASWRRGNCRCIVLLLCPRRVSAAGDLAHRLAKGGMTFFHSAVAKGAAATHRRGAWGAVLIVIRTVGRYSAFIIHGDAEVVQAGGQAMDPRWLAYSSNFRTFIPEYIGTQFPPTFRCILYTGRWVRLQRVFF